MEEAVRQLRAQREMAADFMAANPRMHSVSIGGVRRDASGNETVLGGESWVEPEPVLTAQEYEDSELAKDAAKADLWIAGAACVIGIGWAIGKATGVLQ